MKHTWIAVLGASAVTGGLVAAVVGGRLGAQDAPEAQTSVATPGERRSPENEELVARLDALATENEMLRARLGELERRPAPASRKPEGFVSQEEFDAFREQMRAALAGPAPLMSEPGALRDEIATALSDIRHEEAVQKVRDYQERRADRLEEDLVKLEEWLELSPYQAGAMRGILVAQYDREDEQRRLWEEGGADEILAERKRADGEEFYGELAEVLSEEQLNTFWSTLAGRGK